MAVCPEAHPSVGDTPVRAAANEHWYTNLNPQVSPVCGVVWNGDGGTVQTQRREGKIRKLILAFNQG